MSIVFEAFLFVLWLIIVAGLALWWQSVRQREAAYERVSSGLETVAGEAEPEYPERRLRRRWIWVPWALGLITAAAAVLAISLILVCFRVRSKRFSQGRSLRSLRISWLIRSTS